MGNDTVVGLALVGVGAFFIYKYFIEPKANAAASSGGDNGGRGGGKGKGKGKSKNIPPPGSHPIPPPPSPPTIIQQTPPPPPVIIQQVPPPIIQQPPPIINYYYDYTSQFGGIPISQANQLLLNNFDRTRFVNDKNYRDYIYSLVDSMTPAERDYWNNILSRISLGCVQTVLCALGKHWSTRRCRCVSSNHRHGEDYNDDEDNHHEFNFNLSAYSRLLI